MKNKSIFTIFGATIVASLCCVTPVLAALAGSSSLASSFSWLAPYHNYLVTFTILVLLYAWYDKLKLTKGIECDCDGTSFFSSKLFLGIVTIFTLLMLNFPQWGSYYFNSAPTTISCLSGACNSDATPSNQESSIK